MSNPPVLVGVVPLFNVQSMTLSQGYRIERVMGSRFSQATAPNVKTITIEAMLVDAFRAFRPALEALALTSRALASVTAPLLAFAGVPVVSLHSGIHTDMQITSLNFVQSNDLMNALKVTIKLSYVPRTSLGAIIGGALDVVAGVGSAFL
jgi:hypothetical protein